VSVAPDATRQAVVRCVDVTKYFGAVRALNRVSLDLREGEVVGLVGENGAGKSTLVKILSGFYEPDEGELWLGDERVEHFSPRRAREWGIQTIHQHLALCDNLGAAANVMLGQEPIRFRIGPLKFIDNKKAVEETKRRIGSVGFPITDFQRPIRRFSGGQRQGVAIARAMLRGFRLIMFDEPTAALSVRQRRTTLELVRRVAEQGVPTLIISHNLEEVFSVADRIVALHLGEVSLDAPVAETNHDEVLKCMTGLLRLT
jgi:ribose transport system ATP-binding protein